MLNMLFRRSLIAALAALSIISAQAADFKVGRFATTPDNGWNANAFWLESDEGIVLIDALLLKEDAKLWAAMLKSTGKPVKGMIITHYHHDHIGGMATLLDELGPFPIYSGKGTADTHVAGNQFSLGATTRMYGERFDTRLIGPDHGIEGRGEVEIAGIKLIIEDIGPGESLNATLIYQPDEKILFTGDTTVHHTQSYTTEQRSMKMLAQLRHIKKSYPETDLIYSGHGDPARLSYLDFQISYIEYMQEIAREIMSEGNYRTEDDKFNFEMIDKKAQKVRSKFPELADYGFPPIIMTSQNIIGIIREFEK